MCIICVDFQKQLITADEARRNMGEMALTPEHREEIRVMIEDRELVEKVAATPARYSFYVDASSVAPEKVEAYLRDARNRLAGDRWNPLDD